MMIVMTGLSAFCVGLFLVSNPRVAERFSNSRAYDSHYLREIPKIYFPPNFNSLDFAFCF